MPEAATALNPEGLVEEISSLVKAEAVGNREIALQIIGHQQTFKTALLRQLEVRELQHHPAYDRIKALNFWPWSGALEQVVAQVTRDAIYLHWQKMLEDARYELGVVTDLIQQRERSIERIFKLEERTEKLQKQMDGRFDRFMALVKGLLPKSKQKQIAKLLENEGTTDSHG